MPRRATGQSPGIVPFATRALEDVPTTTVLPRWWGGVSCCADQGRSLTGWTLIAVPYGCSLRPVPAGPLRLSLPGRFIALAVSPDDVRRLLTESPEPFAMAIGRSGACARTSKRTAY
jgi:hypothetical protein